MKLLSPHFFKRYHTYLCVISFICFIISAIVSYYLIYISPPDYQQQYVVRIMYIHVPLAWLSLSIYSFVAICSIVNIVWRIPMCYIMILSIVPIGTVFSFLTLVTGGIWGKPIWGTYWVWDARLTSMLILFLFYLSQTIMITSGENMRRIEKPICIISIIGFINIPIIKFSVDIWSTLHQPSSFIRSGGISIHASMLKPLLMTFITLIFYTIVIFVMNIYSNLYTYYYQKP